METNGSKEMKKKIRKVVGNNLKRFRKEFNLKQEELGKILGLSLGTISRIERGLVTFSMNHIAKLCDEFDVEPKYFFETGPEESQEPLGENMKVLMRNTKKFKNGKQANEILNEVRSFLNYITFKYESNDNDKK